MSAKRTFIFLGFAMIFFAGSFSQEAFSKEKDKGEESSKIEKKMITEGNYGEAVEELKVMLKDDPEDPRVYMDLGLAHYGLMRYNDAYMYFQKSEKKGAEWEFQGLLQYALANMEKNREILEAIEKTNNVIESSEAPVQGALKERMASWHLVMINGLLAEKYYYPSIVAPHIIWLKKNTEGLTGLNRLSADVYYASMHYDRAVEDYKKAIEEEPEDVRLHQTLAECLVATGDFDQAVEYYEKTVDLYMKQGLSERDPEVARLKKISRALPKRYKDISDLMEAGRYRQAEEICRKRISLNPGDYAAITQLGEIYWKEKKRRAAIRLFRKVIGRAPDYPPAHLFLGKAYIFENKFDKAQEQFAIFKEKMALLPKMDERTADFYVSALHYLSYLYSTQKHYEKAFEESKEIIELKPDDQIAHYNMAVCYYTHYHDRPKAFRELQKVIEIEPVGRNADMARFYIDYMRRNPDSRVISDFTFLYEE